MFRLSLPVTNLTSISCLACRCLRRTYSSDLLQLCDSFVLLAFCSMLPFHVSLVVACGAPSFHFMFGLSMPGDALTVAAFCRCVTHLFWLRSAQCFHFMFRLSLPVTNLPSISCLACRCLRRTYSCSLLQLCDAFVLVAVCPMLPFHVSLVVACGASSCHFMFGLSLPATHLQF